LSYDTPNSTVEGLRDVIENITGRV